MHGMINRALQLFLRDTYGPATWQAVAAKAELGFDSFEALMRYDDAATDAVLQAAETQLNKPREMLLEDLGTYLVSHPNVSSVRRLLRFGGDTFVDFLHSLDELPDRARLALSDLVLPELELCDHSATNFTLSVRHDFPGFGHVTVGVLRAMADDYGALALLDHQGRRKGVETISVELLDTSFAAGRDFALAAQTG